MAGERHPSSTAYLGSMEDLTKMSPTHTRQPVCFVSMPFGKKPYPSTGQTIDFDSVYKTLIQPAVAAEGGLCLRADDEMMGGLIYKAMFSRLLYSELLIADVTTADPNVLYELGIRHAARSRATILIFEHQARIPFDITFLRAIPYELDYTGSFTAPFAVSFTNVLRKCIREAFDVDGRIDSPLFMLFDDFPGLDLAKVELAVEVFLSYARPDLAEVEKIYEKLRMEGYAPWMDTKSIIPGQRWEIEIDKAIKNADFFLALLSNNSVDRRGVLRKEVRRALDRWQEMLDDDIYLIPVRLEPCEIPEELEGFQVLDVFTSDWWDRLRLAIRTGMGKRMAQMQSAGSRKP